MCILQCVSLEIQYHKWLNVKLEAVINDAEILYLFIEKINFQ